MRVIARFNTFISVNGISVEINFYVVPDDTMSFPAILGRDFILSSDIEITFGISVQIKPKTITKECNQILEILNISYLSEPDSAAKEIPIDPLLDFNSNNKLLILYENDYGL